MYHRLKGIWSFIEQAHVMELSDFLFSAGTAVSVLDHCTEEHGIEPSSRFWVRKVPSFAHFHCLCLRSICRAVIGHTVRRGNLWAFCPWSVSSFSVVQMKVTEYTYQVIPGIWPLLLWLQGGALWFYDLTVPVHGSLGALFPSIVAVTHFINVQVISSSSQLTTLE
jgi:hypothetical protein